MYKVQSRQQYGYTLHHGSPGKCHSLPRGLCLCPSLPRGHPPRYSHKDPVSKWILSHGSHDLSLSDPLAFWESNSDSHSSTSLFMTCPQALSISFPPLPVPQPSQPQPLWSWLLLKHSDTFLEAYAQNLLITKHSPDPCQPPLSPSVSLFTTPSQHLSQHNTFITWHRIFPNFIVCSPPLLCVYYFTIFCL